MEELLSNLTRHAMSYAIRSGITITSGYAINQCAKLLRTIENGQQYDELQMLQVRLYSKIRIISPAINMIELIAARGNTSLDSALVLTKSIRANLQTLASRMSTGTSFEINGHPKLGREKHLAQVAEVIQEIKRILLQLEDAVPLINLAITTSGVNMSTALPSTVSPSRLLQASTFLSAGDSIYNINPGTPAQVGPVFTLSLYMLFVGHALRANMEDARAMTWKEVIHKARVKIMRVPLEHSNASSRTASNTASTLKAEYAYSLVIVEDLDDGRVHSFENNDGQTSFDSVALAGIRHVLPIHQISKIFYADTGRMLNLGNEDEINSPVLLLKRDLGAMPPRSRVRRTTDDQSDFPLAQHDDLDVEDQTENNDYDESVAQIYREASTFLPHEDDGYGMDENSRGLPSDLHPDWLAFEVFTEEVDPESDDEDVQEGQHHVDGGQRFERQDSLVGHMSKLSFQDAQTEHKKHSDGINVTTSPYSSGLSAPEKPTLTSIPALRTSLSLLELLIRLTALQQFQQTTHLAIEDELLNFFLSESSSTGAGADSERRKAMRALARSQVGFDPYAESPMKVGHQNGSNRPEQTDATANAHPTAIANVHLTPRLNKSTRPRPGYLASNTAVQQPNSAPSSFMDGRRPQKRDSNSPSRLHSKSVAVHEA